MRVIPFIIPGHGMLRRKVMASSKKKDEEPWEPEDKRRIEENKRWRHYHPEESAWDIDKERDAVMYKREALEAAFRLKSAKKERE
jgi:hypothetical protein